MPCHWYRVFEFFYELQEFAVRRRMGMKEIQQDLLEDVMQQGHLVGEKADWLLEEHRKVQSQLEKMYDEEVARQRILLEEKLEKRKALIKLEVRYKCGVCKYSLLLLYI